MQIAYHDRNIVTTEFMYKLYTDVNAATKIMHQYPQAKDVSTKIKVYK